MDLSLWESLRIKVTSLVKPNQKPESTFLNTKPKLTKVVAYDDVLDYNSQAKHIFTQINQEK
jgi:hypothetical protein